MFAKQKKETKRKVIYRQSKSTWILDCDRRHLKNETAIFKLRSPRSYQHNDVKITLREYANRILCEESLACPSDSALILL